MPARLVLILAIVIVGCGSSNSTAPAAAASNAATTATGGSTPTTGTSSAEDIAACAGKSLNAACVDAVDGGDPGTCALATDGTTLFCAEAHGRSGGGSPSAEDVAACAGKAVNAACADTIDGGDPGTCALASDGTTLFCAERHAGAGAWIPSADDVASCSGKAINAACTEVVDGGNPGTCQLASDGITLACCEAKGGGGHH